MNMPQSTVFNVDCLPVIKAMRDNVFDLAIIDTPYGIGESGSTNKSRGKLAVAKDYGNKNWDDESPSQEYFNELLRVSNNQIIWGANHFISKIPIDSSAWIVWDKENGESDFADCELAWTSFGCAVRRVRYKWAGMLQHDMKNKEVRIHPTQKPAALYKWLLTNYAEPGQSILDTHMGSQSSRIAAYDMGFDYTGFELDKEYFDAGNKRFELFKQQQKLF